MSYATTASNHSPAHQMSSGIVAVVGCGMAIAPPLTVPETIVSEEVSGRYAKHGKKYGKSRKLRKHSSDEADDDRDGEVGKVYKKRQKEEKELEFFEFLAELL
ncbi:hypothetical protein CPB97_000339 [Podila verticillata]|nr:hypothetical protein CPB97_000339 [Podila verticillata]